MLFHGGLLQNPVYEEQRESLQAGATSASNKTTVRFNSMPIMATAHGRVPLGASFNLEAGLGAGFATGGLLQVEEETIRTYTVDLTRTARTLEASLPGGPAFRVTAGIAWLLDHGAELYASAEYFYASMPAEEVTVNETQTNASGSNLAGTPASYTVAGSQDISVSGLGLTAGLTFRF